MIGSVGWADFLPVKVASTILFISYTFLLVLIYMTMFFILIDLVRIINHFFIHLSPANMQSFRMWGMITSLSIITILLIIGNYTFNHPSVTQLNITVDKPLKNKEIKIVAASDIHLGSYINKAKLKKYVALINAQKADLVLFMGDIADRNLSPLINQHMNEELSSIKAPLGVFAITGNHEYYSVKRLETYQFFEKSGIKMLIDKYVLVDNSFYIVGRDDRTNTNRKALSEIMQGIDKSLPIILLDHQPFQLEEAEHNNIDLQLSGHTHNGQFFPGNLVVKRIFELSYGYLKKGNTHYYVSSGLGLWGPEYRIGTKSEIVVINFKY
jgi:predicted MPP superfamily phosphohydrolase